jgi:hypothetical protein
MTDRTNQPDKTDLPEDEQDEQDEQDLEGHSMLMYEQARMVTRDRERDIKKHAQEARMLEERKRQKR